MPLLSPPRGSIPGLPTRRPHRTPRAPITPRTRGRVIRRRLALVGALLALAAALAGGLLALTSSGEQPPATGAATVVPADALAYVHLSTDSKRPAVTRARALAARFPDWPLIYAAALGRAVALLGGSGADSSALAGGVRPWLGKEAALALLPGAGGTSPQPLVVLDVANRARARAFLASAGAAPAGGQDGIRVLSVPSGTEFAFVRRYLVAGADASVRAAIMAGRGRATALGHDPTYERAAAGEPAGRVLDAYVSYAGMRRLLTPRTGILGAAGALLDQRGLEGTTASLSAVGGGARVWIHSALRSRPNAPGFKPTIQSILPAGSALMLDVDGLDRAAPKLLRAAATAGFAGNVAPLLSRLGAALSGEGVNVRRLVSIFDGESAVAVSRSPAPALTIIARTGDEAAARSELAAAEAPLTALFGPASPAGGEVPQLGDHEIAGVAVHGVGLGPGLQVDYAVFRGLVVVSTSATVIGQIVRRGRSLADQSSYKWALPAQPDQVSSLGFLDLRQLLALGEQIGLVGGAHTPNVLGDMSRVAAAVLSSRSWEHDTATELSLEIP